jgi:hypothetical protein
MQCVDAGGGGNCLFLSLLAGAHSPKPHPSDYKPPTVYDPFKKYSLTRRPFVSFSLSALQDLQSRIGNDVENMPKDGAEMRRRIVQFEQDHLDREILREVTTLTGSGRADSSARYHITNTGCKLHGTKVTDPEQYFNV